MTVDDPGVRDRVDAAQDSVRTVLDDLRAVGEVLYPPVLTSAGIEAALRSVAERKGIALDLRVSAPDLSGCTRARTCLVVADHLRGLADGAVVSVRVRAGRRLVGVRITEARPTGPRRHWAVLRCA